MKKIGLGILVLGTVLAVSGIAWAGMMIPAADQARTHGQAVEKSPAIDGDWALGAPGLERIDFIHYKDGYAKPDGAKAPKPPACYKFLTPTKVKWGTLPVGYAINPTNPQGLDETFVAGTLGVSAETWDAATSKELLNDSYSVDYTAAYGVQDYKNSVVFGNYPTANVIAVTSVWYNPVTRRIVEFDMMFDTDWTWGDATVNSTVMDLQNIAVHEFGHSVGLGDVYDSACGQVTMYGYSDYGETQKRTLEPPDITGLQTLYES